MSIPLSTNALLPRDRLLELIAHPQLAPITLVTAPAGYGKSTVVRQWARQASQPVAWVTLGPESNHPDRFRLQLATAVEHALPEIDVSAGDDGSIDAFAQALDAAAQAGAHPVVVFDDYHLVENRDVHEAVVGFLSQLPEDAHLVLISRTMPPLPLSRMQAAGAVRHVTDSDLQFAPEELARIVEHQVPGVLTEAQVKTLGERTDGWIAGVRLALASLEHVDPDNVSSLIDAWPASRWLDDYIVEEVLNTLPGELREFVLRTSILPELTPDLCNAVLGIETSAGLLDEVRRRLVFVRHADAVGERISYHPLFAESVGRIAERKWPESDRLNRHRRAALWYEGQGQLEEAVELAVAAEDWEVAARCMRSLCRPLMDSDHHHARLHWLGKLPEDVVLKDPELARWYISALVYTGQTRSARRAFDVIEPVWQSSGDPVQMGYAASSRCSFAALAGDTDQALRFAREALELYPPEHAVDRMHAWTTVNQVAFLEANDDLAEQAHREAEQCRERLPAEQWWWTMHTTITRANQQALRGNLRTARDMYNVALDELPAIYRSLEPRIRVRLMAIALEWNDLDMVRRQIGPIEQDLDDVPRQIWHLHALAVLARLHEALGHTKKVRVTRRRMRNLHEMESGNRILAQLEALQALAWLQSGRIGMAREWAARMEVLDLPWAEVYGDTDPRLAVAQIEIADGQAVRAEAWLREVIERAEERKRWVEIVPLCMWHVVACVELGHDETALASLRLALRYGMPGGLVRSLMTPGYDLTLFLRRMEHCLTGEESAYFHRVIVAQAHPEAITGPLPRVLPAAAVRPMPDDPGFPLSVRELEVLTLMQQGHTNSEIAERLFITERTVKKHVSNILRKLKAPNRTAAVFRAVELNDTA